MKDEKNAEVVFIEKVVYVNKDVKLTIDRQTQTENSKTCVKTTQT